MKLNSSQFGGHCGDGILTKEMCLCAESLFLDKLG